MPHVQRGKAPLGAQSLVVARRGPVLNCTAYRPLNRLYICSQVLVVELNDIRASRKNVGCSCHHSKSVSSDIMWAQCLT